MEKIERQTMTVKEAATLLGRSPFYVRYMIEHNQLPGKCCKIKGRRNSYIVYKKQLLAMLGK